MCQWYFSSNLYCTVEPSVAAVLLCAVAMQTPTFSMRVSEGGRKPWDLGVCFIQAYSEHGSLYVMQGAGVDWVWVGGGGGGGGENKMS